MIRDKGQRETCVLNVGVAWWNPQILIAYPHSIALQPQFWILINPFSILLAQISFIQPQFSIVNSSSSILTQKYWIFVSTCPQNSVISDKMSANAVCSFFQVWPPYMNQCFVSLAHSVTWLVCYLTLESPREFDLEEVASCTWSGLRDFSHRMVQRCYAHFWTFLADLTWLDACQESQFLWVVLEPTRAWNKVPVWPNFETSDTLKTILFFTFQ